MCAVPSAATRRPVTRTRTGAELRTAVHRLPSVRGRRTRETTVPGRTHTCRRTGSPGATVICTCPERQSPAAGEGGVGAAADGEAPVEGEAAVEGEAPVDVEAAVDGERGTGVAAPPPPGVPHAARTPTAAIAHPPAHHHRITAPPTRSPTLPQHAPPTRRGHRPCHEAAAHPDTTRARRPVGHDPRGGCPHRSPRAPWPQ